MPDFLDISLYRDVPGWPGYKAGADGTIWSFLSGLPKERVQSNHKKQKYKYITLSIGKKHKTFCVHCLVLLAFSGPKPLGMVCRHLDGNARNNSASNLAYGTYKENMEDCRRHGTLVRGEMVHSHVLKESDVPLIKRRYFECKKSIKEIATEFSVSRATISMILSGKIWKECKDGRTKEKTTKPGRKLTDEQVKHARQLLDEGNLMAKDIAAMLNVVPSAISHILRNKTWTDGGQVVRGGKRRVAANFVQNCGEKVGTSKLAIADVEAIREMRFSQKMKMKDIAILSGVSIGNVSSICLGKTWAESANGRTENCKQGQPADIVKKIKELAASGVSRKQISIETGTGYQSVKKIAAGIGKKQKRQEKNANNE